MANYVLVHGAWHGGWCWRKVAERLRAAGHQVFTPTLTGLGERAHLRDAEVSLRTHVDDVIGVLRYEELADAIVVGHSYAGFVVREAADRAPERVRRLVLLDAWVGRDGDSMDSRAPDWFGNWVASTTADDAIAVPPAAGVGITDTATAAWLQGMLTPQPRQTFSQATRLTGAVDTIPCRAIVCSPGNGIPFGEWAGEFGWNTVTIESGHDAMLIAPGDVARVLLEEA
jgi:pimeloyl-ACP methyl ester carboxylesterase